MDNVTLFGRYAKVTVFLETMAEVLGFTFVETAFLRLLFPVQQSSKLMHSSPKVVRYHRGTEHRETCPMGDSQRLDIRP